MGYARSIGRVGALAVALGVGVAVATTPAVGYASPDSTSSDSSDSSASAPGADAGAAGGAGDSSLTPKPDTSTPTVTVRSSGGAHTSGLTDDVVKPGDEVGSDDDNDDDDAAAARDADIERPASSRKSDAKRSLRVAPTDKVVPRTINDTAADTAAAASIDHTPSNATDSADPLIAAVTFAHSTLTTLRTAAVLSTSAPPVSQDTATPPAGAHVAATVVTGASDLVTDAFGPLLGGELPSPLALAMLAWTRREIGDGAQTPSLVSSLVTPLAATEEPGLPPLGDPVQVTDAFGDFIDDAEYWLSTYVDFQPWWSGALIPAPIRPLFFNRTPIASPMQVEIPLGPGVTSGPIPFRAFDPDGNALTYSVPARNTPGGPKRGTVTVDNVAGTFTYTPDPTFTGPGTDTFAFVADDDTSPHVHAWENLVNSSFGVFDTGIAGGHNDTATVTVFHGVPIRPNPDVAEYTDITGTFSVLTYNISDMPFPLSNGAFPRSLNTLDISSKINRFDVVNVQQDIAYHPFLLADANFPDRTAPQVPTWAWPPGAPFSDGLNGFSAYDIEGLQRQGWSSGSESFLDPRGFTYTRQHIPGGNSVDVYNVNTGGGALTNADIAQLSAFIKQNSKGRAVIVTGDFNQRYSDEGQTLTQFATDNGLTDAWVAVEYGGITPDDAPTCDYADNCEQTDKVFYRSAAPADPNDPTSSPLRLTAQTYTNEGLNFQTNGQDPSANRPQSVVFDYSVDAVGPQNVDLANWMSSLPGISKLPLTKLPIPGTHDSATYGITPESEWALTGISDFGVLTDFPAFIVKPIAANWSKTQTKSLYDQFEDGIRYVDLRLSNEPGGTIYIEHGLRGPTYDETLADIARYANEHPQEVIIVDMARLTNFDDATNDIALAKLRAAVGDRMVPRSVGTDVTLEEMWAMDKNVIVLYANNGVVNANDDLWYRSSVYQPWPNTQRVDGLLDANRRSLSQRNPADIWGLSGTITPDTSNIVAGVLTIGPISVIDLMWKVQPPLQQWIRADFKESVNLVTSDEYETYWPAESSYPRDIIGAVYETLGSRLA